MHDVILQCVYHKSLRLMLASHNQYDIMMGAVNVEHTPINYSHKSVRYHGKSEHRDNAAGV